MESAWISLLGLCAVGIPNGISLSPTESTWPTWPPRTSLLGYCAMDIPNGISLASVATTDIPAGIVCRGYPQRVQLGQHGHHGHPHWDCVLWVSPMRPAWPAWPPWTSPQRLCAVAIPDGIDLAHVATTDIPAVIVCCGYPRRDRLGPCGHHGRPRWDCVLWLFLTGSAWPMWPPRTSPQGSCAVTIPDGTSLAHVATMDIPAGIVCCGYPRRDQLGRCGHHGHPRKDCVLWLSLTGSAWPMWPPWTSPQ